METQSHKPAGLPCPNSSASFWHSEPSPFLLQHRTTPELPSEADIVIIGSGITGASAARYLAEDERAKGSRIVMLEARDACWGATGRNGGHCQPLLIERSHDVGAFEVKNVAAVKSYIDEHNVDCEWRTVTACHAHYDKDSFKAVQDEVQSLQKTNPELGGMVSIISDAASLKEHRVQTSAAGAMLTQGAGCLWPYKYVTFILEKLIRSSALNLQTHTPVTNLEMDTAGRHVLTTPRGLITARNVMLATNGYTSHLLHSFASLIVPMRCEMSALHPPAQSLRLPDSYGLIAWGQNPAAADDYLIQRPFYRDVQGRQRGGHLMYGGGRAVAEYNCVGETDDDIVDQGEASHLRKSLLRLLELGGETEGLKELRASHEWTGIKGYSRDNTPWVGQIPGKEGLYISAGYTGHGMPNATLCAKAVVEMILSKTKGATYDQTCRKLVDEGDLPQSYILTADRLDAALKLPTVAEVDAAMMAGTDGKQSTRQCTIM